MFRNELGVRMDLEKDDKMNIRKPEKVLLGFDNDFILRFHVIIGHLGRSPFR